MQRSTIASHRPQQLLWELFIFCFYMTGLRYSHFININPCQYWVHVCKDWHWLPSIWIFWLVVADFFADKIIVFTLQFDNFLPSESGGFAMSRACGDRVWRHGKGTAVHQIGWMLVAIDLLACGFCALVYVCVCLSVSIATKVSCRCLEFNVFQILIG